jgi:predicted HicB family RNase H-like nuclease
VLQAPIYLDPELRERLAVHAKAKGISIDQLANELLKRDLDLMESAK